MLTKNKKTLFNLWLVFNNVNKVNIMYTLHLTIKNNKNWYFVKKKRKGEKCTFMHIPKKRVVLISFSFICYTGYCLQTMDSSNSQYRVLQCFYCEESTVFWCITCKQNLCDSCRKKHLHDMSTAQHETVANRVIPGNINIEEMCRMHPENSYIFIVKHANFLSVTVVRRRMNIQGTT